MPWNNQNPPPGGGNTSGPWGNSGANNGGAGKPPNGPNGNSGGGNPGGPNSGGPNSGGGRPPDFDEIWKRSHARVRAMMPRGKQDFNLAFLIAAVIFSLWVLSGFYRVQQDEQGIRMVFGKADPDPVAPGLHYNWPAPIGYVIESTTGRENRTEIGFSSAGATARATTGANDTLMLTGDENIIDIRFVVLWKINDPIKYEFNIRDQEHTLQRAAESAIREVIGETPIQSALTEGRGEISTKTQQILQKMLDEYQAGITVNGVELQAVSPPQQVIDAFSDVQRARSDAERAQNEAEAYRNSILPRAEGEATKMRQDAIGYAGQVVNEAEGNAARFKSVLQSYNEAKDITARRLYLETMESILQSTHKIIIDPAASTSGVLPYLPLSPLPPAAPTSGGQK
jgi:membrane protease subunit HflK